MRVPACKEPTDPFWTRAGPPKVFGLLHPNVILRSLKRCPAMPPSENVYVESRAEVRKHFAARPEATKGLAGLVERYTDGFPLCRRWGHDGSSVQVFERLLPV